MGRSGRNNWRVRYSAKLKLMHAKFHDWDQRVLNKPKKRLCQAQKELEKGMAGPMDDESDTKKKELAEFF